MANDDAPDIHLDAASRLRVALLHLRAAGQARAGVNAADLDVAGRAVRELRLSASVVEAAYLALVEAALDVARDAATRNEWHVVEKVADLTHNVPDMLTAPARWSHRIFRECFLDDGADDLLPWAVTPLRRLLDEVAPAADDIAAEIARAHGGDGWAATRAAIESAGSALDLDEEEIALRVLHALGWPEVEGEDALEVAATAASGDAALWHKVVGRALDPRSAPKHTSATTRVA